MRAKEINEAKPVAPLSPAKARDRAAKVKTVQDRLKDLRAQVEIKRNAAQRKLNEI